MDELKELFSSLMARLHQLTNLKESYSVFNNDAWKRKTGISLLLIEEESFKFNSNEVLEYIDSAMTNIQEVRKMGKAVVNKIKFYTIGDRDKNILLDKEESKKYKEEFYALIIEELKEYEDDLIQLKKSHMHILSQNNGIPKKDIQIEISDSQLPDIFKDSKNLKLDKYQIALLFDYLRANDIILPYSNQSLAKIVALLTGYSEQNLRTNDGFGAIQHIKSDNRVNKTNFKKNPPHNLNKLKSELNQIISIIDSDIEQIEKTKAKKK